jgi:Tetratricopeptide repeat
MSAREALDQAASRLATDLVDQPETQAALWLALGNAYDGLSLAKQAGPALDQALDLVRAHPDFDVRLRVDVMSRAAQFGAESLADSHRTESLGRQAADLARQRLPIGDPARVAALQRLSAVLSDTAPGENNESAALAMQAASEARLNRSDPERTQATQRNLAQVLINSGKLEQAVALFRQMVPDLEKRLGPDNIIVLAVRNDYARVLLSQGKYDQAEPMIRESLARAERRFGVDSLQAAAHWSSLADLYNRMDRQVEAVDAMTRAVDLTNRYDSRDIVHRGQLTCNLAYALALGNRLQEADRQGQECLRLRFLPDADLSGYFKGHAWYVVGTIKQMQGDASSAMSAFEKGGDFVREDANRNGQNLYLALDKTIANLALLLHDVEKAEKYTDDFAKHMKFSDDQGMIGMHYAVLRAKIAIEKGDFDALAKYERDAWNSLKRATGNCERQIVALRDFIRLNTHAAEVAAIDLSETPACASGTTK